MQRSFIVLLLVLAGCGSRSGPTSKPQGTTSSGGGASIELELKLLGRALVQALERKHPAGLELFARTLERARIESVSHPLSKDGRRVDALNFPAEGRIVVHETRWSALTSTERERLVIHEIFGLMGKPDPAYRATDEWVHLLGRATWVSFNQLAFEGPVADTLASRVKWDQDDFVGVETEGEPERVQVKVDELEGPIFCEFQGNWENFSRLHRLPPGFVATGSRCVIKAYGWIEGGSRVVIPLWSAKAKRLWESLGGTDRAGFELPSLHGLIREDGTREIVLELDRVHS